MGLFPSLIEWQQAEDKAAAASATIRAILADGGKPSHAEFEELSRLRTVALEKMRIMVADAKKSRTS